MARLQRLRRELPGGEGLQPVLAIADSGTREGEIAHISYRDMMGGVTPEPNVTNRPAGRLRRARCAVG